MQKVEDIKV